MAEGSARFFLYYSLTSLLYLIIVVWSFLQITSVASQCQPICPMLIPDRPQDNLVYSACLCTIPRPSTPSPAPSESPNDNDNDDDTDDTDTVTLNEFGFLGDETDGDQRKRYERIKQVTLDANPRGYCYICSSDGDETVYQPCSSFDICTKEGLLGFQPAKISSDDVCNTNPDPESETAKAKILQGPTVVNRTFINSTLFAVAVFYIIQLIGSVFCCLAYMAFKDKYGADWGKLTRVENGLGVAAKLCPVFTRIANFLVLFFIIVALVSIFSNQVCIDATNETGEKEFFNQVSTFLATVSVLWLALCVFGSMFQFFVPKDTSFYDPEYQPDRSSSMAKKVGHKAWYYCKHYGP